MAKGFKLRISKAVSSSFNSCRSKDPSILPQDPVPSFFRSSPFVNPAAQLITVDLPTTPPTLSRPHHQLPRSSFKRHVATALVTVGGCRCSSRNDGEVYTCDVDNRTRSRSQEFKWKKEDKWHVVKIHEDDTTQPRRKISYSSISDDDDSDSEILPLPPTPPPINKRRTKNKKNTKTRIRISTEISSTDESGNMISNSEAWSEANDDDDDDNDETESILVSSCRSLDYNSSDSYSSEFNGNLETIYEATATTRRSKKSGNSKRRVKKSKCSISRGIMNNGRRSSVSTTSSDNELPPRLSVFQKLIPCSVDGKVKESFAIVKKSEDPYEDFKRSMMEMIYEKQMFEKKDLEQLLQCFLSLNAKHYHGVIVEAFSEIWKTLFSANNNNK